MAKKLLKYGVALAVGAGIALLVAFSRDLFGQSDVRLRYQYLSDSFFVAAVALGSAGLLAYVSSDGFFDMIGFGVKKMITLLQRDDAKLSGTFYDYKRMKMAKRSGGYGFLLAIAALYLALAALFLLLYGRV